MWIGSFSTFWGPEELLRPECPTPEPWPADYLSVLPWFLKLRIDLCKIIVRFGYWVCGDLEDFA